VIKKELYRNLCNKEISIPIFSRDWWMDAVCGEENWDVILVEKGGQVVAALPYYFRKKNKGIIIDQPPLTQKNGIWIRYPENQKLATKYSFERQIIRQVIDQLEELELISYNQNFDYSFQNWLPFYWNRFDQYSRYTYVLENLEDFEGKYSNLSHEAKKNIKKAEKLVTIKNDLCIEEFYKLNEMTYKRQSMCMPYSLDLLIKIDKACIEHNCRRIFFAEDEKGRKHAALYIVWDENSAYYIMSGADPELRNSEATSLLMWEAIKFSSMVTKKVDFEGSMIESVERFFSRFGAEQKQYFNISKKYKNRTLLYIIAKDVYDYCPWLQKAYIRIRGR
jgi:hypothetical protein